MAISLFFALQIAEKNIREFGMENKVKYCDLCGKELGPDEEFIAHKTRTRMRHGGLNTEYVFCSDCADDIDEINEYIK